jgi:hypothetical protein
MSETRSDRPDPDSVDRDDGSVGPGDDRDAGRALVATTERPRGLVHDYAEPTAAELIRADLSPTHLYSIFGTANAYLSPGAYTRPGGADLPPETLGAAHPAADSGAHAWAEPQPAANSWTDTLTDDATFTVTDALRWLPREP